MSGAVFIEFLGGSSARYPTSACDIEERKVTTAKVEL
jgi:hypothetical protein